MHTQRLKEKGEALRVPMKSSPVLKPLKLKGLKNHKMSVICACRKKEITCERFVTFREILKVKIAKVLTPISIVNLEHVSQKAEVK